MKLLDLKNMLKYLLISTILSYAKYYKDT